MLDSCEVSVLTFQYSCQDRSIPYARCMIGIRNFFRDLVFIPDYRVCPLCLGSLLVRRSLSPSTDFRSSTFISSPRLSTAFI